MACGGASRDSTGPTQSPSTSTIALTLALPALDPAREGYYAAWVVSAGGRHVLLRQFSTGGVLTSSNPLPDAAAVEITVERPGSTNTEPADQVLLRGTLRNGHADLTYVGAVTQGNLSLQAAPGQFTMFTPSDNDSLGYPSHEDAGVWLFNMAPALTAQRDYYVRVTQLQRGWTYEGWLVRDMASAGAIWLSYGKFLPDWTGALNQADDTGWGPFSGVTDYRRARLEDFPGDDWISNPLHLPWINGLALPITLREKDATGALRWTHVITIEPATDRGEPVTTERPFILRPYVDAVGDLGPGVPRTITAYVDRMPRGTADVR
ncbi:hypothetical protein BH11GEM1_BH11GEM1_19270 [soil metagenome]